MTAIKVENFRFEEMEPKTWRALEGEAKHLSPFQTYLWASLLHSVGTEPSFLVVKENNFPLAGLLLSESRIASGVFRAYEAFGGPLVSSKGDETVLASLLNGLKNATKRKLTIYFYWMPSLESNIDESLLKRGFSPIPSATYVVDLASSIEALWKGVDKGARGGVRKAERNGVSVEEAEDWTDWSEYYNLYANECLRRGNRPRSIRLHQSVFKLLQPATLTKLFLAKLNGGIIAGVFLLLTRDEVIWYEGAADPKYLDVSPNNALQWHTIKWAKEHGIKQYDLGGTISKKDTRHFLYGVHMFKKQWGGKLVRYNSFGLNRLYLAGRRLSFQSGFLRRLYYTLENLRVVQRTDRV